MKDFVHTCKRYVSLLLIFMFNCLPIKNNKVFFFSYYGAQYGCNPKYITEYILRNIPNTFDLVWAFNDLESKQHLTGFRKVRTMSLKYFYELCTSKVVITNFRTTNLYIKRENQFYIQTWHSSLRLKQIEKDAEAALPPHYVQMARNDSVKCDLLLSGCGYSTEIFKRSFWYDGEIFEHGTPRNDVLFESNFKSRAKILDPLNIPVDRKVILYAPTFRRNNGLEVYDLNYSKVISSMSNKFGGEWVLLIRLHPHLISKSGQLIYGDNTIDVTTYDDVQELLSIGDVLISDYSSLMFDFSLTKRPCFLYVPDVEEYTNNDRDLYFDLQELPFISATSNDELLKEIDTFNEAEYRRSMNSFADHISTFEEGDACEHIVERMVSICFQGEGVLPVKKYNVGYTTGVFDLFHVGHLNILRRAKEQCNYLIVGVSSDELVMDYKNKKPVIPHKERMEILESIVYVDKVVSQDSRDKFVAWEQLAFDVMFVGDDWKGSALFSEVERKLYQVGADIVYFPYTKGVSTTKVKERIQAVPHAVQI